MLECAKKVSADHESVVLFGSSHSHSTWTCFNNSYSAFSVGDKVVISRNMLRRYQQLRLFDVCTLIQDASYQYREVDSRFDFG